MESNDNQLIDDPSKATATFLSAFILYIVVGCAAFLAFFILRNRFQVIYSPKTSIVSRTRQRDPAPSRLLPFLQSFLLGHGHLRTHMVEQIGLDGVMFLRYLRLCGALFAAFTLLGLPILAPVCAVDQGNLQGINSITFGNITKNKRLWAHIILAYLFVGGCIAAFIRELRISLMLRAAYMHSPGHRLHPKARNLLIRRVPKESRTPRAITSAYSPLCVVDGVQVMPNIKKLEKVKGKYRKAARRLESSCCSYIRTGKGATSKKYWLFGKKRQAIPWNIDRYIKYTEKLDQVRAGVDNEERPVALVTFATQRDMWCVVGSKNPPGLSWIEKYPEVAVEDVIPSNLFVFGFYRWLRKLVSWIIALALIIFWSIITAFAASISTLTNLTKLLPFLDPILNFSSVSTGIIQGILPTLAVGILTALLPMILTILCYLEGVPLRSEVALSLHHKYFVFIVVNVLLVVTIAGGLLSAMGEMVKNPTKAATLLAEGFPKSSTFFVNYTIMNGLMGSAMALLQVGPFFLRQFRIYMGARRGCPRDLVYAKSTPKVDWGTFLPPMELLFCIGICFSVIQPLILPFMTVTFCLFYLVYRYLFLYVMDTSGPDKILRGRGHLRMVSHSFTGFYLFELLLMGLFGTREAWGQFALSVLLLILTALMNMWIQLRYAPRFWKELPSPPTPAEVAMMGDLPANHLEEGQDPSQVDMSRVEGAKEDPPPRTFQEENPEASWSLLTQIKKEIIWIGRDSEDTASRSEVLREELESKNIPVEVMGALWMRERKRWILDDVIPDRLELYGDERLRDDSQGIPSEYDQATQSTTRHFPFLSRSKRQQSH